MSTEGRKLFARWMVMTATAFVALGVHALYAALG